LIEDAGDGRKRVFGRVAFSQPLNSKSSLSRSQYRESKASCVVGMRLSFVGFRSRRYHLPPSKRARPD
jgi:hypothetical protein